MQLSDQLTAFVVYMPSLPGRVATHTQAGGLWVECNVLRFMVGVKKKKVCKFIGDLVIITTIEALLFEHAQRRAFVIGNGRHLVDLGPMNPHGAFKSPFRCARTQTTQ